MAAVAGLGSARAFAQEVTAPDDPQGIYGGTPVETCAWPAAIFVGGCTASLVHPRVVVLAAHCVFFGSPNEAVFGENYFQPERTIPLEGCIAHPQWGQQMPGDGQNDIAICELSEDVVDVPIVPILMGCEADMLQPGAAATLVGFGEADDGFGMGPSARSRPRSSRSAPMRSGSATTCTPPATATRAAPRTCSCPTDRGECSERRRARPRRARTARRPACGR